MNTQQNKMYFAPSAKYIFTPKTEKEQQKVGFYNFLKLNKLVSILHRLETKNK